jgi:signal transduction histidine kinase
VRQALDDCRAVIKTRKLNARLDADISTVPLVMGDPVRLLQAITTLIDHAARSTPERGQILITLQVSAGEVVVRIADTGRGIAPKLLPAIFDMVVDDGTTHGCGGLRLGLTLVKRLIELHDGAVRVSSDGIGKGSLFEVQLPLAPQDVELLSLDPVTLDPMIKDEEPSSTDLRLRRTLPMVPLDPQLAAGSQDTAQLALANQPRSRARRFH